MTKTKTIVLLPGDGIGPEVVGAAEYLLRATGLPLNFVTAHLGLPSEALYGAVD
jgi:isocitrate/isopropylmalate dehydrogenase